MALLTPPAKNILPTLAVKVLDGHSSFPAIIFSLSYLLFPLSPPRKLPHPNLACVGAHYGLGTMPEALQTLFHFILITLEEIITIPMLQMWTMRLRRNGWCAQDHSARKQESQDSNPRLQTLPGHSTVYSTVRNAFVQMQGYDTGL